MSISFSFIRLSFALLCLFFSLNFSTFYMEGGRNLSNSVIAVAAGGLLIGFLRGVEFVLQKFNLRSFNMLTLGLFFGFVLAQAVLLIFDAVIPFPVNLPLKFLIFMVCIYAALILTAKNASEIHLSLPFIEFKQMSHKKKDLLVDLSILTDSRLMDLASCGLLDDHLLIPRFALKELHIQSESSDEIIKSKAKRSLEIFKKLESLPSLHLRYVDKDFPEIKDNMLKMINLARFTDTHLVTSDSNRLQQSSIEKVHIINIHLLSHPLKPLTQAGESIHIKVQRYGKEARQGVGYLDDGTMVVVNGGAEFIGETIKAYVLSVKQTSSGRMIFCNAAIEDQLLTDEIYVNQDINDSSKSFAALAP